MKKSKSIVYKALLAFVFTFCFSPSAKAGDLIRWLLSLIPTDEYGAVVSAETTGNGKVYVDGSDDDPDVGSEQSGAAKSYSYYNSNVTFELKAIPDKGYKFSGWKSSDSNSASYVSTNNPFILTVATGSWRGGSYASYTTRYAFFSPVEYRITYNTDGGILDPSGNPQTYNIKSTSTIKSASKNGYSFDGWEVTATDGIWPAVGSTVNSGISLTGKYGDLTLKALWTPLLADLTIKIKGLAKGETIMLKIEKDNVLLYTVPITGDDSEYSSVTIKDLPTGENYKVSPVQGWNFAYDYVNFVDTFGLGAPVTTCSYTIKKKDDAKKYDEKYKTNWKP